MPQRDAHVTFSDEGRFFDDTRIIADRASLRDAIRAATAADHAALDRALLDVALDARDGLVRFLDIQLAARAGVEHWLADNCPPEWTPPPQTGLIAGDLIALGGLPTAFPAPRFASDCAVDWTGPAYALASSHLSNRLLLAQIGAALPADARRFLGGTAMQDYWRRLRALLAEPAGPSGAGPAIAGARAAFAHFRDCADLFAAAQPAEACS
jgi:heme oxygenase